MKTYEGRRTIDGLVVTVDGAPLPEHCDVKQFTKDVTARWGRIDFLVCIAGGFAAGKVHETMKEVRRELDERLDFDALGLWPYHNLRTESEQEMLQDPAWV